MDRIRRAVSKSSKFSGIIWLQEKLKEKGILCCFYQKGTSGQKTDHATDEQLHLNVCETCFSKGRSNSNPGKACRQKMTKND